MNSTYQYVIQYAIQYAIFKNTHTSKMLVLNMDTDNKRIKAIMQAIEEGDTKYQLELIIMQVEGWVQR